MQNTQVGAATAATQGTPSAATDAAAAAELAAKAVSDADAAARAATAVAAPEANYLAARAARNEYRNQLDALVSQRHSLLRELEDHGEVTGPATAGMQARIQQLDVRIAQLDIELAKADANVAATAAVPGAVIERPDVWTGPPEEAFFVIPALGALVMLPLMIAFAIRILKRGARQPVQQLPNDLVDRLSRLEAMGETTALEVERIGEGQRFVTRILTEKANNVIADPLRVSADR